MNQNINTTPQPHPWVTDSTPDNLRDPQLLQDLSEIGMTCLKGWCALSLIPHSYNTNSEWYSCALSWAKELERLYIEYTQGDDWINKFPIEQRKYINHADNDMSRAYGMLFWNKPLPDNYYLKTAILQRLLSAHNTIRHLVKGKSGLLFGGSPIPGDPDYLDYDEATKTWGLKNHDNREGEQ